MSVALALALSVAGEAATVASLLGSSLRLWLNGSLVTLSGSNIATIVDQSATGAVYTASGGAIPFVASAIGGMPGWTTGTTGVLTSSINSSVILNGTSAERIIVMRSAGAGGLSESAWTAASNSQIPFNDGNDYDQFANTARQGPFAKSGTYTVGCIYGSYSAPSDFQAYLNGTSIFTNATNTYGATATKPAMGSSTVAHTMCEYIVCNTKLAAATRTALYRMLGAKYGIAVP